MQGSAELLGAENAKLKRLLAEQMMDMPTLVEMFGNKILGLNRDAILQSGP